MGVELPAAKGSFQATCQAQFIDTSLRRAGVERLWREGVICWLWSLAPGAWPC